MKYGINLDYLTKKADFETAVKAVAQAGFEEVDYTPDFKGANWKENAESDFEIIKNNGLSVVQTHAPFNRYGSHGENHTEYIKRVLLQTKILGAKYMVVHGDEFSLPEEEYTPEKALEHNYSLFYPIVEKAAGMGIKIAFETVFEEGKSLPRFCSRSEELMSLIEKFNSENVCCCWDFGHANVAFGDEHPEKILEFGKYIECTHVHDSWRKCDTHMIPFSGYVNWEKCMEAMGKIGYKGSLTYEMGYGEIPGTLLNDYLTYMKKVAENLENMMKR